MVYAHLQLARDGAPRRVLAESQAMKLIDHFAVRGYAGAPSIGARRVVGSRCAADDASGRCLSLEEIPAGRGDQRLRARRRGARAGNVARAQEEQLRLIALRDAAKELKLAYWAEQLDIQAALVEALGQCADGKVDDCIKGLKASATREDATEKHAVVPGPLLPARELLSDILLEQGEFAEALTEYEAVMKKEPNRYRAIAGAMAAASGRATRGRPALIAR
jgi:hypothetical protein